MSIQARYFFEMEVEVQTNSSGHRQLLGSGKFSRKRQTRFPVPTLEVEGCLRISGTGIEFTPTQEEIEFSGERELQEIGRAPSENIVRSVKEAQADKVKQGSERHQFLFGKNIP